MTCKSCLFTFLNILSTFCLYDDKLTIVWRSTGAAAGSLEDLNNFTDISNIYNNMKTISLLFIFSLFINGAVTDEIESVSVMLGDSVTLLTNTVIQKDDAIEWRFGDKKKLIAFINRATNKISLFNGPDGRFTDRLKINNQTGDLTITDVRSELIGVYEAELRVDIVETKTFSISGVFGVDADEVKSVSVKERDSVTLHTDVSELQRYDLIQWTFQHGNSPLAEINRKVGNLSTHGDVLDGRFRDKLKLDVQTGSLTIKNIRNKHSGFYQVNISSSTYSIHKSFTVTVRGEVKSVSVMNGHSVTLHTDTEIQRDDLIQWMFVSDDSLIAEIYKPNNIFKTYAGDDERFKDGLNLNNQTGSLTITNMKNEDSGLYELKISSRRRSIHRRFTVAVSGVWNFWSFLVLIVLGIAGVIWYKRKNRDQCDKTPVAVIGGGPITLKTGVKDLRKNDAIEWKYQNSVIAKIKGGSTMIRNGVDEKRSINIFQQINIRRRKASSNRRIAKDQRIADEETTMCEINPSHNNSRTYDNGDEGLFSNKLKLNHLNGDLTLSNLKNEHYGDYKLKTTISGKTTYETFYVFDVGVFESLTVNIGDSVSLKTGMDTDGVKVEWRFGKAAVLAEISPGHYTPKTYYGTDDLFKDKLKLNLQTGDLTVSNISEKHCGAYRLKIISSGGQTVFKSFFVSSSSESKTVIEGESVPLKTNVTDIQTGDEIEWMFEETLIDKITCNSFSEPDDDNGRFRNTLQCEEQTGDLTLNNIRKKHSGNYKLKIIKGGKTIIKTFNVLVMEYYEDLTVNEGYSVPINIGIQTDDVIVEWMCEGKVAVIAEINFAKNIFNTHDGDDGLFKDKLEFNRQTGVLTIKDFREKHYGLYRQKIISNEEEPIYKTLCVFVCEKSETVSEMAGESVCVYTLMLLTYREKI